MSDTEAMTRVMDNAAETARLAMVKLRDMPTSHNSAEQYAHHTAIAALAYARAVLQMVSASVSPEATTIRAELARSLDGSNDYEVWADANDGAALTDTELVSVGRYLRAVTLGGDR